MREYYTCIYIYIYIYISKSKKENTLHIPNLFFWNAKQKKYTKMNQSNGVQYKAQKHTFQTVNKFLSCYIK